MTEAILVNPFEVVKVKMQSNRAHQTEAPKTFPVAREIIKADGYFGRKGGNGGLLNKGITATMGRNGVFNMVYFGFYHSVKNHFPAYSVKKCSYLFYFRFRICTFKYSKQLLWHILIDFIRSEYCDCIFCNRIMIKYHSNFIFEFV